MNEKEKLVARIVFSDSPGEMERLVNSLVNDPLVKNAYGNIVSQRKRFMMAPHPLKES